VTISLKMLRTAAKVASMVGRELADVYAIPAGQALTRWGIEQNELRAQRAAGQLEHLQAAIPEHTEELGRLMVAIAAARRDLDRLHAQVRDVEAVLTSRRRDLEAARREHTALTEPAPDVKVPDEPAPDGWTAEAADATPVPARG
jgi:hypothetical protein